MYNTLQLSIVVHSLVDFYQPLKILGLSTSKYMDTSLCYKVKASIFYFKIPILFLCKTKNSWRSNKEKIYQVQGTFKSWNEESEVEVKQYNPQLF